MKTTVDNPTAQRILKGLRIEIESEWPNLKYAERITGIIEALEAYLDLEGLVLAYEDDLDPDKQAIMPNSYQFRRHIENALGIDNLACEDERQDIITMAQGKRG